MKEDYLWDKTGGDPEIEKLENALAVFRYRETKPPALPAKIVLFEKERPPRRFFQFAFAFAACAAFVIVSLGIWFQFSDGKTQVAGDSSETITPQKNIELPKAISDEKPDNALVKTDNSSVKDETPKQVVRKNFVKARKATPLTNRRNERTEKIIIAKNPILALTEEEKYAYNQLMLALSITSSKLRLVEDKINGAAEEEPKAVNKKGQ